MHPRGRIGYAFTLPAVIRFEMGPANSSGLREYWNEPTECGMPVEVVLENIDDQVTPSEPQLRIAN